MEPAPPQIGGAMVLVQWGEQHHPVPTTYSKALLMRDGQYLTSGKLKDPIGCRLCHGEVEGIDGTTPEDIPGDDDILCDGQEEDDQI